MSAMLRFATFTSDIELSFYASLASHKINHDKLDDSPRRVIGLYELQTGRMALHGKSLTSDDVPLNAYRAEGVIKNYNTIEEYRNSDKALLLEQAGRTLWEAIIDGTIFSCPSLLASFTILCFSDLKKYKFTYLFGYPALHTDKSWQVVTNTSSPSFNGATEREIEFPGHLSPIESTSLVESVATWRYGVDSRQWGFFLAKRTMNIRREPCVDVPSSSLANQDSPSAPGWIIGTLADFENGFFEGTGESDRFICFADPSPHQDYPGWPLRNLLILARKRWGLSSLQVICYRDIHVRRHEARSLVIRLEYTTDNVPVSDGMPKVTGWERGPSGKVVSKIANLGEYMDPAKLADQAVDLNLKLIKWRIAPSLDLDVVKNTKCLLLGAGTLGSYVSRNLLGWGVKTITFVDNGHVSFSNPVRQPLFNFEDCLGGGLPKAERAATALREIYPGVTTAGYKMSVPMAGHAIIDEAKTREEFETLARLFNEHDVIFLLMDSRESRWLPTVMGKATGKLVMNAALGFDTYVVMRHGLPDPHGPTDELGCYFCNDVVAPMDSTTDRTLDQQCTVTRPGVAAIASALTVELMVSVLQEKRNKIASDDKTDQHPLGSIPHTLRGFLSSWNTLNVTGRAYDQCSACSSKIVQGYKDGGWNFVKQALNDTNFVAELSGLAEIQRKAEEAAAGLEWDEGEDDLGALEEEGELL